MGLDMGIIHAGDSLAYLQTMDDESVDMILTDPPYGADKTEENWDKTINIPAYLAQFRRVIKPRGAVCIFAAQPFTSDVIIAGRDWFRYAWYWEKENGANVGQSGFQPFRVIEEILVFSRSPAIGKNDQRDRAMVYYPQMEKMDRPYHKKRKAATQKEFTDKPKSRALTKPLEGDYTYTEYRPDNLLKFNRDRGYHSTQKPVRLLEYLIRTYTLPGETVFDAFGGSGSTAVAARNLDRRYIICERETEYIQTIHKRLGDPYMRPMF